MNYRLHQLPRLWWTVMLGTMSIGSRCSGFAAPVLEKCFRLSWFWKSKWYCKYEIKSCQNGPDCDATFCCRDLPGSSEIAGGFLLFLPTGVLRRKIGCLRWIQHSLSREECQNIMDLSCTVWHHCRRTSSRPLNSMIQPLSEVSGQLRVSLCLVLLGVLGYLQLIGISVNGSGNST